MSGIKDPLELFRLRPVKAAKVSEISETTAASPVPPEERVNFHIGNPVQDERLVAAFLRIASGLDARAHDGPAVMEIEDVLAKAAPEERPKVEFLLRLIRRSAPYTPRGGYLRNNPNELITTFGEWLERGQQDPLVYDLGAKSGVREVILATGGILETFRVFLHAVDNYLVHAPARLLLFGLTLPEHLHHFPSVPIEALPESEDAALHALLGKLTLSPDVPTFLALGRVTREETRRTLRQMSFDHPLFVIEANDAPNSMSLAREARMSQRVLRFLSPAVLSTKAAGLPTMFIAGNPEFVTTIEVAHFQLKGTPSAPEMEHLSLLLAGKEEEALPRIDGLPLEPAPESVATGNHAANPLGSHVDAFERIAIRLGERQAGVVERLIDRVTRKGAERVDESLSRMRRTMEEFDPFAGKEYGELFDELVQKGTEPAWQESLRTAFLSAFLKHHPEYDPGTSTVVSGSSRTALGLLGFHCGIREVVIPDLSWTYEHCFPRVAAIPLTEDLQLDVDAMLREVERKIAADPQWAKHGAVALNNPHNATGQAFHDADVRKLLRRLLERRIYVIDDLAYQNVAPVDDLRGPLTLRQMANDLVRGGYLTEEQASRVVSVHSVSKTDCLAGSRLAVVDIRDPELRQQFVTVNDAVIPNVAAIFLSYLFYRGKVEDVNAYWRLRNCIFDERMTALEEAAANLPAERNEYAIRLRRPTGSMYPLMMIERLPAGLSLDWLSSGLARQGIGLLPLSAFARTEKGFEAGRKAFRLTLGGTDPAERLAVKTRRVLIDLNRMMEEEESRYTRRTMPVRNFRTSGHIDARTIIARADTLAEAVREAAARRATRQTMAGELSVVDGMEGRRRAIDEYIPERLELFRRRVADRAEIAQILLGKIIDDDGRSLSTSLERELYKDSLDQRREQFRRRLFDRTVHPTQMYSLQVEILWEDTIRRMLKGEEIPRSRGDAIAAALLDEYAGLNVAITSAQEGGELLLDMKSLLAAEDLMKLNGETGFVPFLSYWGDWDGSTRPSGQGHQLVATVLIENVRRLAELLRSLQRTGARVEIPRQLHDQMEGLELGIRRFENLLTEITLLTHQLERRYKGVLPFQLNIGRFQQAAIKLHLARDPLTSLWQHNDRLERRMLSLRHRRRDALHYYFGLNKALRKALHSAIPSIQANIRHTGLALEAAFYRDLLQRVVITPRIHQKMITAQDQFAIDTTVHNITEINDISGTHGNPGMILSLQVSMSTSADALIALDRKLRAEREERLRSSTPADLAPIWLIPLFEELNAVKGVGEYLNKLWDYAVQSRRLRQETRDRFTEILPEVFIAGSDLSQQVGQTAGMALFKEAKKDIVTWLAERDLVGAVRIKMGSGEPMQRQGGYYAPQSGLPAFRLSADGAKRLSMVLPASAKKSVEYARTPLMGVFAAGDLRTFQSNLAEHLRRLPAMDYAQLLNHVYTSQRFYEFELTRAAEPLVETRLRFTARGLHELERLTVGKSDKVFDEFVALSTENFRHIVYGKPEDVVGIHIVSYFVARTTPPLRDRPTIRPGRGIGESQGHQILERIAQMIPLSARGSLLRAIAHNQAQTAVLGVNQLTTGLFRAFHLFAQKHFPEGPGAYLLADRVLPVLPVYEILHSLRLFHDPEQIPLGMVERAFPAGNSALTALREDIDAMGQYLGLLRKELIRRHGLNVANFFDGETFHPDLLPTIRPDLAVLLQPDLFNTDPEALFREITGVLNEEWAHDVKALLAMPVEIRAWRARAWELLYEPVFGRVQSFVELALALASLSDAGSASQSPFQATLSKRIKLAAPANGPENTEDSMRQFLNAAFEYLTGLSQQIEVPTTVVRALQEVERIIKIEEQALSPKEQEELRFYLLQIARVAGENG